MYMYPIIILLTLLVVIFILNSWSDEHFQFEPNMITSGDYHIEQPGAIADQGSFVDDMQSYLNQNTF
jgi:hypothetical protein